MKTAARRVLGRSPGDGSHALRQPVVSPFLRTGSVEPRRDYGAAGTFAVRVAVTSASSCSLGEPSARYRSSQRGAAFS